jgi:hypothetical protein
VCSFPLIRGRERDALTCRSMDGLVEIPQPSPRAPILSRDDLCRNAHGGLIRCPASQIEADRDSTTETARRLSARRHAGAPAARDRSASSPWHSRRRASSPSLPAADAGARRDRLRRGCREDPQLPRVSGHSLRAAPRIPRASAVMESRILPGCIALAFSACSTSHWRSRQRSLPPATLQRDNGICAMNGPQQDRTRQPLPWPQPLGTPVLNQTPARCRAWTRVTGGVGGWRRKDRARGRA